MGRELQLQKDLAIHRSSSNNNNNNLNSECPLLCQIRIDCRACGTVTITMDRIKTKVGQSIHRDHLN